jgi:hypothetical protein
VSECPSEAVSESGGGSEGKWGIVRVGDCPYIIEKFGLKPPLSRETLLLFHFMLP